ncbi:hypothetical protein [Streptomyces sp. NPDC001020]
MIWIAGAAGPITLLHVRRMARLFEAIDNRIIPAIQVDLDETLRAEGSVQFDRGRLVVTRAGLVHTPPYGQGGEFAWSQVRSVKASSHGELEIPVTGQPPIRFRLLNAWAAVEVVEELHSAADGGRPENGGQSHRSRTAHIRVGLLHPSTTKTKRRL